MFKFTRKPTLPHIMKSVTTVIALVLIWRGVWYTLDGLDLALFGGSHVWTSIVGVGLGLLILYLPDKDLKELDKL